MMKAVYIDKFVQSYDEIKVSNIADPKPKDNEVVIEIAAAGVNYVDLLYAKGKHQNNRNLVRPPFVLGLEFAGTVISAPAECNFVLGDRVFGAGLGSYATRIAVKPSSLHKVAWGWSFRDAAGIAATAPVSYGALIIRGKLRAGETVLIHAAAGGLGLMAVQIAKAVGATVIATAGSEEKLAVAKRFGADHCVNYNVNEDWWRLVLELTDGHGVEVVYDSVGLVDQSLKCLQHKGRVIVVGFAGSEGDIEKIAMNRVLLKQAQIIGYRFGETGRRYPQENLATWYGLKQMLEQHLIEPTIFDKKYYGLESVVPALVDLAERRVWGKAVVVIGGGISRL
ncbi:zeta-crystallin [Phlyctema vagabunda]|uniref:Zeta-crystallin n=1 Tax=Phlyctema vagabunda TaxID=108571 RepID=A0ABR4P5F3_9HELO